MSVDRLPLEPVQGDDDGNLFVGWYETQAHELKFNPHLRLYFTKVSAFMLFAGGVVLSSYFIAIFTEAPFTAWSNFVVLLTAAMALAILHFLVIPNSAYFKRLEDDALYWERIEFLKYFLYYARYVRGGAIRATIENEPVAYFERYWREKVLSSVEVPLQSIRGFILTTEYEWGGLPIPPQHIRPNPALILVDLGSGDHRPVCSHYGPKPEVVRLHGILTEMFITQRPRTYATSDDDDPI